MQWLYCDKSADGCILDILFYLRLIIWGCLINSNSFVILDILSIKMLIFHCALGFHIYFHKPRSSLFTELLVTESTLF